jgi:hypothetical protein
MDGYFEILPRPSTLKNDFSGFNCIYLLKCMTIIIVFCVTEHSNLGRMEVQWKRFHVCTISSQNRL